MLHKCSEQSLSRQVQHCSHQVSLKKEGQHMVCSRSCCIQWERTDSCLGLISISLHVLRWVWIGIEVRDTSTQYSLHVKDCRDERSAGSIRISFEIFWNSIRGGYNCTREMKLCSSSHPSISRADAISLKLFFVISCLFQKRNILKAVMKDLTWTAWPWLMRSIPEVMWL